MFTNDTLFFKTTRIEKLKNILPLIESMCDCTTSNSNNEIKITGYKIIEKFNNYTLEPTPLKTSILEKRLSFTDAEDCNSNGYIQFPAPMSVNDLYGVIKSWYEKEPLTNQYIGDGSVIKALELHSGGECCDFDEMFLSEVFYVKVSSVYISK